MISKYHNVLGASPDGVVNCCCGTWLLEIKCPFSIHDQIPTVTNISYIEKDVKSHYMYILKKNHRYHSQFHMGIANIEWSDFFVFTCAGSISTRVLFHKEYFEVLVASGETFFTSQIWENLKTGP